MFAIVKQPTGLALPRPFSCSLEEAQIFWMSWEAWLTESVNNLQAASLRRCLHPVVATSSSVEVRRPRTQVYHRLGCSGPFMPDSLKGTLALQVYITTDVLNKWLALSSSKQVDRPSHRNSDAACNLNAATAPVQLTPEQLSAQLHEEGVSVHCCHNQSIGTADQQGDTSHGLPLSHGMHRLRLFSLNDYMGMSAHPAVRLAAAEAAAACGSGKLYNTTLTRLLLRVSSSDWPSGP